MAAVGFGGCARMAASSATPSALCRAVRYGPTCAQVVSPLGPSAVALAASSQVTQQRLLVDEYTQSGSSYELAQPSTELAAYLHKRWVPAWLAEGGFHWLVAGWSLLWWELGHFTAALHLAGCM